MARQDQFSTIATEVANRYTLFLEQLQNSYNRTILGHDINSRTIKTFRHEVENINKQYLEREVEELSKVYETLDNMIKTDTNGQAIDVTVDEEWEMYLSENTNFLYDAVRLQSTKDTIFVTNYLRAKVLEVISMNSYETAYHLTHNNRDLAFFYTDKIGRKINSVKYIRTVSRDYLVKNYNDMIAGSAILNGVEKVTIVNVDAGHGDHEKIISVNEQGVINYFAIRNETFHPNTNSIIRL